MKKWVPANVVDIIYEMPCEGYVEDIATEERVWNEVFDQYGTDDRSNLIHEFNYLLGMKAGLLDKLEEKQDGCFVLYRYKKWMKYQLGLRYTIGNKDYQVCEDFESYPIQTNETLWLLIDTKEPGTILDITRCAPMGNVLNFLLIVWILVVGLLCVVCAIA